MRTDSLAVVVLLLCAAPLAAQNLAVEKLQGTVKETVASRSVGAASVSLVPKGNGYP